eukprot:gnl/TRDRNA2_/TRDRNA2_170090_c0_seq1.p1 gnl/TRDRNA2_/TRDRNA2_170090_c0~~gnl/TRDRNA2_/TRDRNA2_170090_c0_seq1.p1  ORF type:complete len:119 (+),score=9.14 gnl/TRDRNA2_/TRDRNA2_170090_c0_seq1:61-417(+)
MKITAGCAAFESSLQLPGPYTSGSDCLPHTCGQQAWPRKNTVAVVAPVISNSHVSNKREGADSGQTRWIRTKLAYDRRFGDRDADTALAEAHFHMVQRKQAQSIVAGGHSTARSTSRK